MLCQLVSHAVETGVGDCGHDKAEDVDSVHYTLLTRLSELLPLLVFMRNNLPYCICI